MLRFSTLEMNRSYTIKVSIIQKRWTSLNCKVFAMPLELQLATYLSTLLRYVIVIEEEIDSLGSAPTRSNECSRGQHRFSSSDHTPITPSTRLPCQRSPLSYHAMLVSYAYLYLYRFCARIQNARIRRFHINFGAIKKHPGVSRPRQRLNTTSNVLTRLI